MNVGAFGSRSSSGLDGFLGVCRDGVGMSTENLAKANPRDGWVGMVPGWVLRVIDVLRPTYD